jgi:hypothetical protein
VVIPVITGATGIVTGTVKKNLEVTRKTFSRFTTKDSCTWNITHNMERSQNSGDRCWFKRRSTREKRPARRDGDDNSSNNNKNNVVAAEVWKYQQNTRCLTCFLCYFSGFKICE